MCQRHLFLIKVPCLCQGPYCTGKTGGKITVWENTGDFEIPQNTRNFVCSSCITCKFSDFKVKDITIIAENFLIFSLRNCMSLPGPLYTEIGTVKKYGEQGSDSPQVPRGHISTSVCVENNALGYGGHLLLYRSDSKSGVMQ